MSVGHQDDINTSPGEIAEVEILQVLDDNDKEGEQDEEVPDTFSSDVIDRRKVGLKKNNKFFTHQSASWVWDHFMVYDVSKLGAEDVDQKIISAFKLWNENIRVCVHCHEAATKLEDPNPSLWEVICKSNNTSHMGRHIKRKHKQIDGWGVGHYSSFGGDSDTFHDNSKVFGGGKICDNQLHSVLHFSY